jgi:hypothetical protein
MGVYDEIRQENRDVFKNKFRGLVFLFSKYRTTFERIFALKKKIRLIKGNIRKLWFVAPDFVDFKVLKQ